MSDQATQHVRPLPRRPDWGWFAWEATVGYIHDEYSTDVTLRVEMYPVQGVVLWAAALLFGENSEQVTDCFGLSIALEDLWRQVSSRHQIFRTLEAAARRPEHYADDRWIDTATLDALTRLVGVTATIFKEDWKLMVFYRPVPVANARLQARLIAHDHTVLRSGRGATLRDACRNLFHNATPDYKRYSTRFEDT